MILDELSKRCVDYKQDGKLVFNKSHFPELEDMLNTLPEKQLIIQSVNAQVIENEALVIGGSFSDTWPLFGFSDNAVQFSSSKIELHISVQENAAIETTAKIWGEFENIPVLVTYPEIREIKENGNEVPIINPLQWTFSLSEGIPEEVKSKEYSLSELVTLARGETILDFIPGESDLFRAFLLNTLNGTFDPGKKIGTSLLLETVVSPSNASQPWTVGFLTINDVGFRFYSKYEPVGSSSMSSSWGGDIHGNVIIGDREFRIALIFDAAGELTFEIESDEDKGFPAIAELAELAGGKELKNIVETGCCALGIDFNIKGIRIVFDLYTKKLTAFVESEIKILNIPLHVFTSFPDFRIFGSLTEGTDLYAVDILKTFSIPTEDVPDLYIKELNFSAVPQQNMYSMSLEIDDAWSIELPGDKFFALEQVILDVSFTGGVVTGTFSGTFNIAGVDLIVSAGQAEAGAGWQFTGSTGQGQEIPIGELIDEIANLFGNVTLPEPIKDLVIQNLYVSFNTKTKNFSFSGEARFPIDDKEVDIIVTIDIRHTAAGTGGTGGTGTAGQKAVEISFSGKITIGTMIFDIKFEKDPASTILVATYSHTPDQPKLKIKDLVSNISSEAAAFIPESLEIDLKDVLFVYSKTGTAPGMNPPTPPTTPASKFLLGMDIGTHISLSDLPVAGSAIPKDQNVGVDDLQVLIASKDFTRNEVTDVNSILPAGVTRLPLSAQSTGTSTGSTAAVPADVGLKKGLNFSAKMQLGGFSQPLMLPVSGSSQPAISAAGTTPPSTAQVRPASSSAAWFPIKKDIGPLHFERVGFQYKDGAIWFLLDAALSLAGLTISLDGLGLGSPLNEFKPQFNLNGLGIDYKTNAMEIGGAFLKVHVKRDGMEYDEYSGSAVIKTAPFSIAAIGSYTQINGDPSLFIYTFLDMPLGGPAFFFVNGLAAGFGYNRSLIMPPMNQIAAYPLVEEAVNGTGSMAKNNLSNELQKLSQYIPPDIGQIFLAAGIKFNSFKLVDSFALLAVSFGKHFEIDLLGLSTAVIPTPEAGQVITPLAVVQMALRAQFIPDQGFLGVEAQLTPGCYILSRDCRLTGGFAFYSWFSGPHSGDFALTLGGYHPNFRVPAHYPRVPRLGFNWQLTREISIKGDAYFALCPHALMAGGHLEALFQSGPIKAWFNAGADFLMSWKPFYYEASCHVNVGGSYTFECFGTQTITINVGAELNIWGPDFSGDVTVDLWIISFTIGFGNSRPAIAPIDWSNFRDSFLPAENDKICSISVKDGLVRTMGDRETERWIINPKNFSLTIDSAVPAKTAFKKDIKNKIENTGNIGFGIGPMDVQPKDLSSELTVILTREGQNIEDEFQYIPVLKSIPTAMWGTTLTTDLNGPQFIDNALCGVEIKPAAPPPPGDTRDIDRAELAYDTTLIPGSFQWEAAVLLNSQKLDDTVRSDKIKQSIINNSNRNKIMADLGVDMEIDVNPSIVDSFLYVPQIEA